MAEPERPAMQADTDRSPQAGWRAAGKAFAVTVTFQLEDGAFEEFLRMVGENAVESVRSEPDCLRFDVLVPPEGEQGGEVLLYEIYRDRAAFDSHLVSGHFLSFDRQTRPMVRAKSVVTYFVAENAKGQPLRD